MQVSSDLSHMPAVLLMQYTMASLPMMQHERCSGAHPAKTTFQTPCLTVCIPEPCTGVSLCTSGTHSNGGRSTTRSAMGIPWGCLLGSSSLQVCIHHLCLSVAFDIQHRKRSPHGHVGTWKALNSAGRGEVSCTLPTVVAGQKPGADARSVHACIMHSAMQDRL